MAASIEDTLPKLSLSSASDRLPISGNITKISRIISKGRQVEVTFEIISTTACSVKLDTDDQQHNSFLLAGKLFVIVY